MSRGGSFSRFLRGRLDVRNALVELKIGVSRLILYQPCVDPKKTDFNQKISDSTQNTKLYNFCPKIQHLNFSFVERAVT